MNIYNVEQTQFEVVIFNTQLKWSNLLFSAAKFYMYLFMNFLVLRDFIRFSVGYMTHKRLRSVALKGVRRQSPGQQRMEKMCKALEALGSVLANT